MRTEIKNLILHICALGLSIILTLPLVQAQESTSQISEQVNEDLDQAELDQMLAPIALYPDTLLSHILVASTYPLEVIMAARWRAENEEMTAQEALDAVEEKSWDPSVKALAPFNDLLQRLSGDIDWLQKLGDAFLLNEGQVLSSVQNLRQKAYAKGNLTSNEYLDVAKEDGHIVIQSVRREVVYVPYYDTRVVYGDWWWSNHHPYYWHHPRHYVSHYGFYWGPSIVIHPSFYFGGFHWHNRHVVVDYHYRNNARRHSLRQRTRTTEYSRWQHNSEHRRGVRYHQQQNPNRFVSTEQIAKSKQRSQIDKQRILNVSNAKYQKDSQAVKRRLAESSSEPMKVERLRTRQNDDHQRYSKRPSESRQLEDRGRGESQPEKSLRIVNDKQKLIDSANQPQRQRMQVKQQSQRPLTPSSEGERSNNTQTSRENQRSAKDYYKQRNVYRKPTHQSRASSSDNGNSKTVLRSSDNKSRHVRKPSPVQK